MKAIEVTYVPFEMSGRIPLVEVEIEGEKMMFFFDSGAQQSILNAKYFKNTKDDPKINLKDVRGNVSNVGRRHIKNLGFATKVLEETDMLMLDLSHLEIHGKNVYGIVGYDLIKDSDIYFDYKRSNIALLSPENTEAFIRAEKLKNFEEILIKMAKHLPIIEGRIGEFKYNLALDTGCESLLISIDRIQDISKFTKDGEETTVLGAASESKDDIVGSKLSELKIGKKTYKELDLVCADISHLSKSLAENIDGIIGYPFLSANKMILSYKQKHITLFE